MPNFFKKLTQTPPEDNDNQMINNENFKSPALKKIFIKFLKSFVVALIIIASLIIVINYLDNSYYQDDEDYQKTAYEDESEGDDYKKEDDSSKLYNKKCNVLGISVVGHITTFQSSEDNWETASDSIIFYLDKPVAKDNIKAIFIEINSSGGNMVAAEEIAEAIKRTNKPTVAVIREYGNSAAYLVASAVDTIFASKNSDVGSIGVTMSYLDYSDFNQQKGIKYVELSSGKFKDTGDPDKPLSQEEVELLMRDINISHENFIELVAENRGMDIEKVRQLADGSTMMGQMALENGLIDRIGLFHDAVDYLEELLGEEVEICWY